MFKFFVFVFCDNETLGIVDVFGHSEIPGAYGTFQTSTSCTTLGLGRISHEAGTLRVFHGLQDLGVSHVRALTALKGVSLRNHSIVAGYLSPDHTLW